MAATRPEDVLYVAMNLISVKQLAARGFTVSFLEGQRCEILGNYDIHRRLHSDDDRLVHEVKVRDV